MTPYILDNQGQRCHLSFVIFTKTEIFDQSADFFITTCVLGGRSKSPKFTKNLRIFFCTRKHALNAPFFGK